MRRFFIKTYGCQMNVADSSKLTEVLMSAGYREASEEGAADVILVNTCVVRQTAEDRASAYIQNLIGYKRRNPDLKLGVCGCLVTEPGRDLKKLFPHVDWFIPPNGAENLKDLINSPPLSPSLNKRGGNRAKRGGGEFVTIMQGCDNFCTYCIVPYVRGREYSRPMDEVLAEIEGLWGQGAKGLTLLGQNVNSYKYGLADLLRAIEKFIEPRRLAAGSISFLTSHPKDLSDDLIHAVAELPYVAKEFMMPLQSGDNEILERMNRGYTLEHYLGLIKKIRSLIPKARLFSDIMVGFPGETEEQFENTLRAVQDIGFNMVHMFAYSPRPGTAASKMPDQVPEEIKKARLQRLIETVREVVRT